MPGTKRHGSVSPSSQCFAAEREAHRDVSEPDFKAKGISFLGILRAVERQRGAEVRDRIVEALPGEVGEAVRVSEIIASGWYPIAWYAELLRAVVDVLGGGPEMVRRLSAAAVIDDFSTIFKLVRLILSPERVLQMAMKVNSRYLSGGAIDVLESKSDRFRLRATDYHGYNRLLWADFLGGAEGVLTLMKARELESTLIAGGDNGDDWAEFLFRWQP